MVGLGIGLHYAGSTSVGYFKPLGTNIVQGLDEDVLLFKDLFELDGDPLQYNLEQHYHRTLHDLTPKEDIASTLMERYTQLSAEHNFMIIESAHTFSYGYYTGLSAPQIAHALECPGLVVAQGAPETILDKCIMARQCFEHNAASFLGAIINNSPDFSPSHEQVLTEHSIPVLGVIPPAEELRLPTARDVIEALDGELLAGEEGLHNPIETVIVGAMTYDTAQRTLKTMETPHHNILVTGGDRADMQLLAFELKSSLLVLTGKSYPSMSVLSQADTLQIPVVLVPYDTMTTATRCEQVTARITPSHAPIITQLIKTHVDLDSIEEAVQK